MFYSIVVIDNLFHFTRLNYPISVAKRGPWMVGCDVIVVVAGGWLAGWVFGLFPVLNLRASKDIFVG